MTQPLRSGPTGESGESHALAADTGIVRRDLSSSGSTAVQFALLESERRTGKRGWNKMTTTESHSGSIGSLNRSPAEQHRSLLRTQTGLRGIHQNVLDRATAGDLTSVICHAVRLQPSAVGHASVADELLLLGYDGRSTSADLYPSVLSAAQHVGCNVISINLCTPASLLYAMRTTPGCRAGILVTGLGCASGWSGLDVFDVTGESPPIAWERYGIRLESLAHERCSPELNRHDSVTLETVAGPHHPDSRCAMQRLVLPAADVRAAWKHRPGRSAGWLRDGTMESRYRNWLAARFTGSAGRSLTVVSSCPLIRQRLHWLEEQSGIRVTVMDSPSHASRAAIGVCVEIPDDDRSCEVRSATGMLVGAPELALIINASPWQGNASELRLTAIADEDSGSVRLLESNRSTAAASPFIRDALALVGTVASLPDAAWNRINSLHKRAAR